MCGRRPRVKGPVRFPAYQLAQPRPNSQNGGKIQADMRPVALILCPYGALESIGDYVKAAGHVAGLPNGASGIVAMRDFRRLPGLLMIWTMAMMAVALIGSSPLQAESPAAKHIQSYYQQLMPTIQQAGRLSVRERDKRFEPAITSAFDLATMTRLAVGPKWATFSPDQQAAVRDAFAHFIIADYASQVSDYSGESFVVELANDSGDARRRRDRQVEAAAARRPDGDDQLFGPRWTRDRRLFQRHGE